MNMVTIDEYLTRETASRVTGLHISTISRFIKDKVDKNGVDGYDIQKDGEQSNSQYLIRKEFLLSDPRIIKAMQNKQSSSNTSNTEYSLNKQFEKTIEALNILLEQKQQQDAMLRTLYEENKELREEKYALQMQNQTLLLTQASKDTTEKSNEPENANNEGKYKKWFNLF